MEAIIVTPTTLPATAVTLAEIKTYLRLIDAGENDDNLTAMLAAAIGYVQDECDLTLLATSQVLDRDRFPHHRASLSLPIGPVLSVESISYENRAGEVITLPTDSYRLVAGKRFGKIRPMGQWPHLDCHAVDDVITIEYTTGYASREAIPPILSQAVKMIVAGWFQVPEAWTDRTITETPALTRILNLYRSWAIAS